MKKEIWKTFFTSSSGTEYAVSNLGRLKNVTHDKIKKPCIGKRQNGVYWSATFRHPEFTRSVHRLVAEKFVSNPDKKPEVDHIDRNPLNNRASNLRWVTRTENNRHSITVKKILMRLSEHFSIKQISEYTGLTTTQIGMYLQDSKSIRKAWHECSALDWEES